MKKPLLDKLTAAGVNAELLAEVLAAHGQAVQVEKDKLEPLNTQITTANTTIQDMKNTVSKFEGVDLAALNKAITDGQVKYDTDIAQIKRDSALTLALTTSKAKNSKALMALLDHDKIKLDGDKLLGLDDQLTALKASDAYLFNDEAGTPPPPDVLINSGLHHGDPLPQGSETFDFGFSSVRERPAK